MFAVVGVILRVTVLSAALSVMSKNPASVDLVYLSTSHVMVRLFPKQSEG